MGSCPSRPGYHLSTGNTMGWGSLGCRGLFPCILASTHQKPVQPPLVTTQNASPLPDVSWGIKSTPSPTENPCSTSSKKQNKTTRGFLTCLGLHKLLKDLKPLGNSVPKITENKAGKISALGITKWPLKEPGK